jgi:hypothetical protein
MSGSTWRGLTSLWWWYLIVGIPVVVLATVFAILGKPGVGPLYFIGGVASVIGFAMLSSRRRHFRG